MNKVNASLAGILASIALLFLTAHLIFFLPLLAFSMYFGWNYGKRIIPPNSHGV